MQRISLRNEWPLSENFKDKKQAYFHHRRGSPFVLVSDTNLFYLNKYTQVMFLYYFATIFFVITFFKNAEIPLFNRETCVHVENMIDSYL